MDTGQPPAIELIRAVLGRRAAGVAVVTTRAGDEQRGLTVSAWCSVTLDPPLVLACVEQVTTSHDLIERSRVFAVNILAREQEFLADRFAGRAIPVGPDFVGVPYQTAITGAPILAGSIGWLDCQVTEMHPAGTHSIVVGAVVAAGEAEEADLMTPLLLFRRRYTRPLDDS